MQVGNWLFAYLRQESQVEQRIQMTSLKDQIAERIRKERDQPEKPEQKAADTTGSRLDEIRPGLDELSYATENYSLTVEYAKGPYAEMIAVVELDDMDGTWVASWQIAPTISGSGYDWEVTYNPYGVETQRERFAKSDELFLYLTASIAERIIEMEADGD